MTALAGEFSGSVLITPGRCGSADSASVLEAVVLGISVGNYSVVLFGFFL